MKKTIISILLLLITMPVFGAQMCVKTNTYISVFRASIDGTDSQCSNSDTNKIWQVTYDYRKINGFASCNAISGSTDKTTVGATGATTGVNCWCKIGPVPTYGTTTGVVSYWAYLKTYDSDELCAGNSACTSGCTYDCMMAMKTDSTFRGTIFDSIW